MSMESSATAPTWEACKENVLPIKRGRSVKGLSESLQKNSESASIDKLREKLFEDSIIAATKSSPKELLDSYILYFKWTRDTYPSNAESALKLLERCTCDLKDEDELKNDQRFVKMWIEYADMVKTPGEIFSFMQSNKIGEKVALFWIAWAFVAEKVENFKLTDQIFQKGIRRQAEPKEMLGKRYQQFQRRLARHYLNNMIDAEGGGGGGGGGIIPHTVSSSSNTHTTTSSSGSRRERAQGLGVNNENRERRPLGGLTAAQGDTADRRHAPHMEHTSTTTPHTISTSSRTVRDGARTSNATFQIFSDQPVAVGTDEHVGLTENPNWKVLGNQATKKKENEGPVTKWTEGPLIPARSSQPVPSAPTPLASMISIFVDKEFEGAKEGEGGDSPMAKVPKTAAHGGLRLRQQLEGSGTLDSVARIASNPLERHKLVPTPFTQPSDQGEIISDVKDSEVFGANTHSAIQSSGSDRERERERERGSDGERKAVSDVNKKSPAPIVIFSDATSLPIPKKASLSAPKNPSITLAESVDDGSTKLTTRDIPKRKETNSFAIYNDSDATSFPTTIPKKLSSLSSALPSSSSGFTIFEETKIEKKTTSAVAAGSFSIFQDEKKQVLKEFGNERIERKEKGGGGEERGRGSGRGSDERAAPLLRIEAVEKTEKNDKNDKNKKDDNSELDNILAEMGILDSEDGTINTRLARKDIDSMFCSPSAKDISNKTEINKSTNFTQDWSKNSDRMDGESKEKIQSQSYQFNAVDKIKTFESRKITPHNKESEFEIFSDVKNNNFHDKNERERRELNLRKNSMDSISSENYHFGGENTNTLGFSTSELSVIRENSSEDYSIFGQLNTPHVKTHNDKFLPSRDMDLRTSRKREATLGNSTEFTIYTDYKDDVTKEDTLLSSNSRVETASFRHGKVAHIDTDMNSLYLSGSSRSHNEGYDSSRTSNGTGR